VNAAAFVAKITGVNGRYVARTQALPSAVNLSGARKPGLDWINLGILGRAALIYDQGGDQSI
jgi:hypothetical protein